VTRVLALASRFGACGLLRVDDDGDLAAGAALGGAPRVALAAAHAALHPDERVVADAMAPARRRDWIAGRAALRALFADAAVAPPPVAADDRGAPVTPPGWVASISHKRGLAAALLAPDAGWTIGVDLEVAAPPRLDVASRVLTDGERAGLAGLAGDERGRRITLVFAIKEAVYKAIDPVVRRFVGFREVEVALGEDGTCAVRAVDATAIPVAIEAEWREHAGLWVCTARARRT
jgi:4'-phosphopantetheinyl transferase EntD